jgi:hypothetical protein
MRAETMGPNLLSSPYSVLGMHLACRPSVKICSTEVYTNDDVWECVEGTHEYFQ